MIEYKAWLKMRNMLVTVEKIDFIRKSVIYNHYYLEGELWEDCEYICDTELFFSIDLLETETSNKIYTGDIIYISNDDEAYLVEVVESKDIAINAFSRSIKGYCFKVISKVYGSKKPKYISDIENYSCIKICGHIKDTEDKNKKNRGEKC